MSDNLQNPLTYIVFEEEGKYVAVCLEHWIGAQGDTKQQAENNLCINYRAELDYSVKLTGKPFMDIPPAPKEYQDMVKSGVYSRTIHDKFSQQTEMAA